MSQSGAPTACPHLNFNHRTREVALNREEISKDLRQTPIFWTDAFDGFYVVTSHKLAKEVLRKPEFTTETVNGKGGMTIPPVPFKFIPAEVDGPDHVRLRRALNPMFGPESLEKIRPWMEKAIDETIDALVERGEFDITHDVAEPLPAKIILTYLGFDPDQAKTVVDAGQSTMGTSSRPEEAAAAFDRMKSAIKQIIEDRLATPRDDAVTFMIQQDGSPLRGDDLYWAVFTMTVGGIENVAALLENSLYYIAQTPELRKRLIENPDRIPQAVEEFARFFTPGGGLARTVAQEVELGGVKLKPGDRVFAWLPSANKDEEAFANPDTVDIDRPALSQHLSFGHGRHFCIAASLARMEIAYIIKQMLAKMPNYTVDTSNSKRFENAGNMYGWWKMPAKANV